MEQQKFRVMNKDTGKVKEVSKAWLDIAKQSSIFNNYEMIGPITEQPKYTIEDVPTVFIPPHPENKIPSVDIDIQPVIEEEPKKAKRGRKSKQK